MMQWWVLDTRNHKGVVLMYAFAEKYTALCKVGVRVGILQLSK